VRKRLTGGGDGWKHIVGRSDGNDGAIGTQRITRRGRGITSAHQGDVSCTTRKHRKRLEGLRCMEGERMLFNRAYILKRGGERPEESSGQGVPTRNSLEGSEKTEKIWT